MRNRVQFSVCRRRRFARHSEKLIEDCRESFIEVVVVGFLKIGHRYGLRNRPQRVVSLPIEDRKPEHRTRVCGAVLLVRVGRAIGSGKLKLKHQVCL